VGTKVPVGGDDVEIYLLDFCLVSLLEKAEAQYSAVWVDGRHEDQRHEVIQHESSTQLLLDSVPPPRGLGCVCVLSRGLARIRLSSLMNVDDVHLNEVQVVVRADVVQHRKTQQKV